MFASQLLRSRGTVCFDQLDRAAQLTEIVEAGRPFYDWVEKNNKTPQYFADWSNVIAEYHREHGSVWTEPIAVNSPYGFMGYELIKPPPKACPVMRPIPTHISSDSDSDLLDSDCDESDTVDSKMETDEISSLELLTESDSE